MWLKKRTKLALFFFLAVLDRTLGAVQKLGGTIGYVCTYEIMIAWKFSFIAILNYLG